MDEAPVGHPGVPEETYRTLGAKTLWIFVLQRIHASFIVLLVAIGFFAIKDQSFLKTILGRDVSPYIDLAAWAALGLFAAIFILTFLFCWLIYVAEGRTPRL